MTDSVILAHLAAQSRALRDLYVAARSQLHDPAVGEAVDVHIGLLASAADSLDREAAEAACREVAA